MTATQMVYTKANAKNLPNTIFPIETGAVKSNWSVLECFSSANTRIVRTGTVIKKIKEMADKE